MINVYHIHPHYLNAQIWSGDPLTGQRVVVHNTRPTRGQTRRQRYEAIAAFLNRNGLTAPSYREKR